MLNSNILELPYHPQFLCDRIFLNAILANLGFLAMLPVCFKHGWGNLLYFKQRAGMKI